MAPRLHRGGAERIDLRRDRSQPATPSQTCVVQAPTSVVGGTNVKLDVVCTMNEYTVGVDVSGLNGEVNLKLNGGNTLTATSNGVATFTGTLASGSTYDVTVATEPASPTQTCVVSGPTGTVVASNVSLAVTCTTNTYTIGGTISGLSGTGLILEANGGNGLPVSANGSFTFASPVSSGASYAVTIGTQPGGPAQTCVVTSGTGTVTNANITNVTVTCTTNTYTIGGTISGLAAPDSSCRTMAATTCPSRPTARSRSRPALRAGDRTR